MTAVIANLIADIIRQNSFVDEVTLNNGYDDDIHITVDAASFKVDIIVTQNIGIILVAYVSECINYDEILSTDDDLYSDIVSNPRHDQATRDEVTRHANAISNEIKKFAMNNIIEK